MPKIQNIQLSRFKKKKEALGILLINNRRQGEKQLKERGRRRSGKEREKSLKEDEEKTRKEMNGRKPEMYWAGHAEGVLPALSCHHDPSQAPQAPRGGTFPHLLQRLW